MQTKWATCGIDHDCQFRSVDIDDIDKGKASRALVYLLFYKVRGGEICVAAYAGSTHLGSTR